MGRDNARLQQIVLTWNSATRTTRDLQEQLLCLRYFNEMLPNFCTIFQSISKLYHRSLALTNNDASAIALRRIVSTGSPDIRKPSSALWMPLPIEDNHTQSFRMTLPTCLATLRCLDIWQFPRSCLMKISSLFMLHFVFINRPCDVIGKHVLKSKSLRDF